MRGRGRDNREKHEKKGMRERSWKGGVEEDAQRTGRSSV